MATKTETSRAKTIAKVFTGVARVIEAMEFNPEVKTFTATDVYDALPNFHGIKGGEGFAYTNIALDTFVTQNVLDRVGTQYRLNQD